jgi:hypothetical protein
LSFNEAAQAVQASSQAFSQQKPSTQKLLTHWAPAVQANPVARGAPDEEEVELELLLVDELCPPASRPPSTPASPLEDDVPLDDVVPMDVVPLDVVPPDVDDRLEPEELFEEAEVWLFDDVFVVVPVPCPPCPLVVLLDAPAPPVPPVPLKS